MKKGFRAIAAAMAAAALLGGCSGEQTLMETAKEQLEHVTDGLGRVQERFRQAADPAYQEIREEQPELEMKYYYSLLDEESRQIYRELAQGQKEGREVIVTHGSDPAKVNEIYAAVCRDYPEFFWCSGTVETTGYDGLAAYCEVRPEYICTMEEREIRQRTIDAAVEECLKELPQGNTYDQIRYLYEWIIQQTEYVTGASDSQNIYSVFGNGKSVCAGYARAFQYLAERAGIRCVYVTGTVGQGESHAWNLVQCGGAWYNVDVTFGDPVYLRTETDESGTGGGAERIFYDYLCVPDADFRRNHTPDAGLLLPECSSDDLEYYRMIGRYFETADQEQMLSLMKEDIEQKAGWSDFRYGNDAAYQEAVSVLETVMDEAACYLCRRYGLMQTVYEYSMEPDCMRISVYWDYGG